MVRHAPVKDLFEATPRPSKSGAAQQPHFAWMGFLRITGFRQLTVLFAERPGFASNDE
jgi:hypothetical protein